MMTRKLVTISTNCDCSSNKIQVRQDQINKWVYGPRCPGCNKVLGPMQWDVEGEYVPKKKWRKLDTHNLVAPATLWIVGQRGQGDVLWKAGRFLQALPDPFPIGGFISLYNVTAHPFQALKVLGIEAADLKAESLYTCPYTNYDHFGIMPTAVLSENVEAYRPALEIRGSNHGADFALDCDFHRSERTDKQIVEGETCDETGYHFSGLFELTSVQRSLLGTGYTVGTLMSDGHGAIKHGRIELDNGDWLFVHFWEWYNK